MPLLIQTSKRPDGNMSFRYGGQSEVFKNRERFLAIHNISLNNCIAMSLQNGTESVVVTSNDKGSGMTERGGIEADCIITNETGLFLFLLTGDCLPVTFHNPKQSVIALAHIGRHNAGKTFVSNIIEKLRSDFHCKPQHLIINIGPGIHKESYIKPNSIPQASEHDWQPFLTQKGDDIAIDILSFVVNQLIKEGLPHKNIHVSPIDTAASDDYFSHYRDARANKPEGRFATVVGLRQ